jgi:hypothetical protein
MRRTLILTSLALVTASVVVACRDNERRPGVRDQQITGPSLAKYNDPARIDTGGGRLPDLIVDGSVTQKHWVVRDEKLQSGFCSVEEGNITPGTRRIIRFTVTTPNIGKADVYVGDPIVHMDPNGDGNFADQDGMFEFASCHNHYHFQHYAQYKMVDVKTGKVWKAAKRGFCMLDTDPNPSWMGEPPAGDRNYLSCGTADPRDPRGFQGVAHGWADTYHFTLGGQFFVLDGGDGQAPVPPGDYYIEVTVNPAYAPPKRGGCPLVTDRATGLCHQFAESDYSNNTSRAYITIPAHPGKGVGPEKDSAVLDYEPMKGM